MPSLSLRSRTPSSRGAMITLPRLRAALPMVWRVLWRVPMMLFLAAIVFGVLRVLPVDPLGMLLPPSATEADVKAITQALGLDRPIPVQFGLWLGQALQGDLGRSIQSGLAVTPLILKALPTTVTLVASGMLLGIVFGVGGGLFAFRFRGTRIERAIEVWNSVSISVPEFLWAILLILGVGIGLKWLPFLGPIDAGILVPDTTGFLLVDTLLAGDLNAFGSAVSHLALPMIALSLGIAPPLMRILHSSLTDVYAEDYVAAARLRGLSESRVLVRHALKNAALPTVSMIGMQASTVIGGTLLIETIFGFPGIGSLMVGAIGSHDLPMIQGLALTYAVAVQATNMLTDTLLIALNPRLRQP